MPDTSTNLPAAPGPTEPLNVEIPPPAQLFEAVRSQGQYLEMVNTITRIGLKSSSLAELLPALAEYMTHTLGGDSCYIVLWDSEKGVPYPAAGYGEGVSDFLQVRFNPNQPSIARTVLETQKALYVPNYALSPFADPRVAFKLRPHGFFGLPLFTRARKLGAVLVEFRQPDPANFPPERIQTWENMIGQISLAVHKTFLYEEERDHRREAEALQISTALTASAADVDQMLESLLDGLDKVIPFDAISVSLQDVEGEFEQVLARTRLPGLPVRLSRMRGKSSMLDLFGADLEPVILADIQVFPGPSRELVRNFPMLHGALGVALRRRGEMIGTITMGSLQPNRYTPRMARLAQAFADQATTAIEKVRLFEQVRSASERLQQVSSKLVEVQESERRMLARELHDEIGGELTALGYALEMSKRVQGEAQQQSLTEAQQLVSRLMQQVRELSLRLRPTILDDLGLEPALEWLIHRFQVQTGIQVHANLAHFEPRCDAAIETAAFRVAQEALTNAARYSRAKEVFVNTRCDNNSLEIMIVDQGIGFDLSILENQEQAFGLLGMQERTNLVGGDFSVQSAPGQGTCIRALYPVR